MTKWSINTVITTLLILSLLPHHGNAQAIVIEKDFLRAHIRNLTSPAMHGRGYVMDGGEIAAAFLQRKFSEFGIQPVLADSTYTQPYVFSVNTFPDKMKLKINGKELMPGKDYVVDAGSVSYGRKDVKVKRLDMATVDSAGLQKTIESIGDKYVYVLDHVDSFCKVNNIRRGHRS